jgi:alkyldihydroxyacetonephosphate synthase
MKLPSERRSKWWGWGKEGEFYHLPDPGKFWNYVRESIGETERLPRPDSLADIKAPGPRLPDPDLARLRQIAGEAAVSTESDDRVYFSLGRGYGDLVRLRKGEIAAATDAVVRPQDERQVLEIVRLAAECGFAVVPFGGGTSVVGGVEPSPSMPTVTLDMDALSKPVAVNRESATATVQTGIMGPDLERHLGAAGFTLGHFPQSFMHSSVGGWIATRSAGQNSTKYGPIEERVQSLRLVHPGGIVATPGVPAAAAGPDLVQLIAGSEGTLGVITEATLRLAPKPEVSDYRGYLFPSFTEGISAAREIMQSGAGPACLRLSDSAETASTLAMRAQPTGRAAAIEKVGRWYLGRRGLSLETGAIMILGLEGDEAAVKYERAAARNVLARHGAVSLGRSAGQAWKRGRFEAPHLRDLLLDHGILIDTLETSTTWDRYLDLHQTVTQALRDALGERSVVMAHLSHSYTDGGSVYFTFLAPQERDNEIPQWERVKAAATDAIVRGGGALSHHHGIGGDHRPWMREYLGEGGAAILAGLKQALDPAGVMNPGKLIPDSTRLGAE